ncbi:RHS repeat-associated core domain-containing protein [Streptomyces chromofuscus]|uniref:RHS repeat-associated core domain-containing protein n=3 Tax=Streptomyces chromofuscus TaxID=42881 RepID=A0A7M2TGW6_STRCW|nr:polymorphic toxin-type HINT domain-containing protein [Streptomyces chromofuscus]QOV47454.1 RHS repeat-associated core domain-containing protein [Streptomyces chromofuscus]
MLPGLLTPVAFAATPDPLGAPTLEPPRSAKVRPFTAKVSEKPSQADRKAAERARRDQQHPVTWPTAGTAILLLGTGATSKKEAGTLPVTASTPGKGRSAKSLTVEVLSRKDATRLGVKGVVLKVSAPAGGKARLSVGYSAFASAYGGDWAGRLQLFRLPDCADGTLDKAGCRTRTELDSQNHRTQQNVAATLSLPASGAPMMLALAAGTQSGAGDYKATPLSPSSTWEAGGGSGTFTWSYPLRVPPAAAGPEPNLALSYDSGSIDGRTASTNNQGSQVGEGFDLTSSYIERKYGSCDDDGQTDKSDLCWKYDNASLVLNGKATELVKDDTSGKWRLQNDDASTVIRSSGADNGDDNGEHWAVTTGDGTKYVFGLNKLDGAGADDRTNSVWTVPVFGDDEGEPGYDADSTFSGRAKTQAWRWNLDYVEDSHGNASTYWYTAETNHYDTLGDDTIGTEYVRGGYLREIRYGQRAGTLFSAIPAASNKVVFGHDERCLATGTGCDALTETTRNNWPDVPFDAVCKADVKCTGNTGPTFFTRKRLTTVTSYAWNAAAATPAYEPVDAWTLKHLYLDPGDTGDSSDQSLWLDEIRHTGKRGTDLSLNPVQFGHEMLANRVDGPDNILPLHKPRLKTVTSETGAKTSVSYLPADCAYGQTMPRVDTNTKRCYPVYWSPNGEQEPILDWFQKYPVSAVSVSDPTGGGLAVEHSYQYSASGGAWHYNEDPLTPAKERTWSIWRGYERVTHLTGVSTATQSKTVTVFMRGMHGDRVLGPDGKTPDPTARKTVTVTGIRAAAINDLNQYAGFTRETATYNGSSEVSGTINNPWSKLTATQHKSYADIESYYVRTSATHARTKITSGITPLDRVRTVRTTYDDYGMPATVDDEGDRAVTGDEKCTRTWYARNDAAGINSLVSRSRTVAKPCATADTSLDLPADSSRPGDVISDTATVYDNPTATTWPATQTPTKGEATWSGRAKAYDSSDAPLWQKIATTTYDTLGRTSIVKDTNDNLVSKTTYTPAAAGPLTATDVENIKLHKTTTQVDFATGAATKVIDPNNMVTQSEYDSLGRLTKVWLPNRSKALGATPNYVYAYNITNTDMSWVSTGTLNNNASGYNTSYAFYDAQLRLRQTQSPTPAAEGGRIITVTRYDTRGMAYSQHGDIYDSTSPPTSTPVEVSGGQAPIQTDTTFDGAGRPTETVNKTHGITRWTTTTYTGDTVSTSAPNGGQATAVVTNALGQTTERREYAGSQPTGTDYTTTRYTYHPAGQQDTITGPDQTEWTYTYDLFGRQIESTDPDKGKTTTDYNELDQTASTTANDDSTKKLLYGYDELGRQTGMWQTDKTDANKLAAWTFDTATRGKGKPYESVRYDGGATTTGKAYTKRITTYDNLGNATASQLDLPEGDAFRDAGVPSTLSLSATYRPDGTVAQTGSPAVGGLPSEIVSYTYNATGQQLTSTGTTGYLHGAAFSPQGDLRQLQLGTSSTKKAYLNWEYEPGTRRLTRAYVTDDVHSYMAQELKYTQDDAGNVTSIFDATTQGGTTKADYQCFTYDGHRRLTEAWTPKTADCATSGRTISNIDGAAPYWTTYAYTQAGQRQTETQHTTAGDQTTTYTYNDPTDNKPHTLDNTTGARTATYSYDNAGNTTSRPGATGQQTLAWNTEGKLTTLTEGAKETGYLYDADGELLIRRAKGDGDAILYLGGGNEVRLTTKGTTKTLSGTRYYTANGQTIAVRTATSGVAGTKLSFLASDHHGTSSIALEAGTYAVTKRYTSPFGSTRGTKATSWPDDKAFLGAPADESTGLTHIGAREYDPVVGQFISVDPLLELDKHQTLNGYSYAVQNPLTHSDPTGMGLACNGYGDSTPCPTNPSGGKSGQPDSINSGGGGTTGGTATASGAAADYRCGFPGCSTVGYTGYGPNVDEYVNNGTPYHSPIPEPPGYWEIFEQFVLPDIDEWKACGSNPGFNSHCGWAATDLPALKALKLLKLLKLKKTDDVLEEAAKCTKCFLAGTDVLMADGTTKDIEDIKVGDTVQATDPETGETGPREVTKLIITDDDKHFNELSIATEDGIEKVTATYEHPFWSPSEGDWIEAGDLTPGATLLTDDGNTVIVTANRPYTRHATTYNLTVDDLHTYYVLAGETPVLVHNSNGNCGVTDLAAKIDVENLSMTKTVENHTWDIAGTRDVDAPNFGKAARPYMNGNNGQLLRGIMEGSAPRMDSRGAPGVVEWRTPGAMNGSNGIWELNIDANSNRIVHFLFKSTKG